jgi:hypothetical protein
MDNKEFDKKWGDLELSMQQRFGKIPNLEAFLFLIGIQESGQWRKKFTKEQKQDLMHVAVCTLLSSDGHFERSFHDAEGWPHFIALKPVPALSITLQERMLKEHILDYFQAVDLGAGEGPDPEIFLS